MSTDNLFQLLNLKIVSATYFEILKNNYWNNDTGIGMYILNKLNKLKYLLTY